jgi:RHS repeat-associated protein
MLRTRHLACAFLASTCLTSAALAQTSYTVSLPEHLAVDGNHVDHVGGAVVFIAKELSIGPDGPGGLTLLDYQNGNLAGGGPIGTNWDLSVRVFGSTYSVNYGAGVSEPFTLSGGVFTSQIGSGATLTQSGTTYTYTSPNGTIYTFDYTIMATGEGNVTRGTKVAYPTGEVVTLVWGNTFYTVGTTTSRAVRLQSVSNANGYQFHYNYAADNPDQGTVVNYGTKWQKLNNIIAVNTAVDYCDPTAYHCGTLTQTPATVSYLTTFGATSSQTSVTDALSRVTTYYGDSTSFKVTRPGSSSPNYVYTLNAGKLTQAVIDGQTYNYSSSISGTLFTLTETDPLSHTDTTVYDQSTDQIKSHTDGNSKTTTYTYDTSTRLHLVTYPELNSTEYTYDSRGNTTKVTQHAKPGSGLADTYTSAVFPTSCTNPITCNEPTSTTDANLNTTNYTYDPAYGNVLTVTSPAVGGISPQTRYTYTTVQAYTKNSSGSIVASGHLVNKLTGISACRTTAGTGCSGTSDEAKTTISYGPQVAGTANNLLPVSVKKASGDGVTAATTSVTYDTVGNLATSTDPLSRVTAYFFDADREPLGMIGPDPDGAGALKMRATKLTYNADGLVTLVAQGTATANTLTGLNAMTTLQQVATTYDGADRKIQDSVQAGGTTYAVVQYAYDAAGRLQCTAQRMNPSVFASLPASACTLGTTGSYGPDRITFDTYDAADQLTKVTTGYGVTTANGFPATLQRDETTYTWSSNGKVKTLADAKNNLTTYIYDGFDRLSQTQYPSPTAAGSSNAADYEQLGYDAAGNVTGRRLRGSALAAGSYDITYGYDALERLSSKTLPSPEHGVTYAYDNFGQPRTITGATTLSYVFDALGRETSETQAYGSVTYLYDLANRRTRLTWQDGTYLAYDYDNADEMSDIKENGSTVLASFTYDDLGERKTRTLANGTSTTYGYDPVSRLTSLALAGGTSTNTVTLSNYSPAGEIGAHANSNDAFAWTAGANVNRSYTINGLNQFATIAGATQGYDGRGNLTSSGGTTYAYTSENLLKTVSTGQTLTYDPVGRLQEYDVPTATRFVYDGGMISEEVNTSGTVLRRYAFGPSGDEPIVWYEGSGTATKRYMDQDERGSVTRITDTSGTIIAINSYDEYGIPGASNQGRFGYTGQAWLPEIGLAYYKARMYSPTLGRFLQTDPTGYAGGPNWYNYVSADPINNIDPFGLVSCPDGSGEICVDGHRPPPFRGDTSPGTVAGGGPVGGGVGVIAPKSDEIVVTAHTCPGGHVHISQSGSSVSIYGTLTYIPAAPYFGIGTPITAGGAVSASAQSFYTNAINSRWTGRFGRYNVTTHMVAGSGGLPTYVSPAGSNGWGNTGGSFMQFADNSAFPAYAGALAAHEFGHGGLGLSHAGSGLMQPNAQGNPTEQNISDALSHCGG